MYSFWALSVLVIERLQQYQSAVEDDSAKIGRGGAARIEPADLTMAGKGCADKCLNIRDVMCITKRPLHKITNINHKNSLTAAPPLIKDAQVGGTIVSRETSEPEATMRAVIERLRAENSPAFHELLDLHTAVDELVRGLEQLAEQAGKLSDTVGFMRDALRELRNGVREWNIAGVPAGSDGGGSTPAPEAP